MILAQYEIPVAYSMVAMATQLLPAKASHPIETFMCYWAAFNNIYVTVAEQKGRRVRVRRNNDGSLRTRPVGQVNIPEVAVVSEREQLDLAFMEFSNELKRDMIEHPSTRFFVYRAPYWRGQPITYDGNGQRLNGVLNVGYTVDAANPVWTPIDLQSFENYNNGARDEGTRDALARQILDVLYTVRNNTFHGGKRADDANDRDVLEKALPLLITIVGAFLREP